MHAQATAHRAVHVMLGSIPASWLALQQAAAALAMQHGQLGHHQAALKPATTHTMSHTHMNMSATHGQDMETNTDSTYTKRHATLAYNA